MSSAVPIPPDGGANEFRATSVELAASPTSRGFPFLFLGAAGVVAAAAIVVAIMLFQSNWLRKPLIPSPGDEQALADQARRAAERDNDEAQAVETRRLLAAAQTQLEQLRAKRETVEAGLSRPGNQTSFPPLPARRRTLFNLSKRTSIKKMP